MEMVLTKNHSSFPSNVIKKQDDNLVQCANILQGGYKRASEAVLFFEDKASEKQRMINKAFFMYLSVKKDAQRTILEKIAHSLGIELTPVSRLHHRVKTYENTDMSDEGIGDIFNIIHEIAADELEFYLAYSAVEKNARAHSLLLMLVDMAKEFLFDVKIWYLNHKEANCF